MYQNVGWGPQYIYEDDRQDPPDLEDIKRAQSREANGSPPNRKANGSPPYRKANGSPPYRKANGSPPNRKANGSPSNREPAPKCSTYMMISLAVYFVAVAFIVVFNYEFINGNCDAKTLYTLFIVQNPNPIYSFLFKIIFYSFFWLSVLFTLVDVLFHLWFCLSNRPSSSEESVAFDIRFLNEIAAVYSLGICLLACAITLSAKMPLPPCQNNLVKLMMFSFTRAFSSILISVFLYLKSR